MAEADDLYAREPARPATSALGSTSLVVTTIVLMSAVGSFGLVRVLSPKLRTPSTVAEPVSMTTAAAATHGVDARRELERPTTGGRLSIVTDPAGAQVEIDGRRHGVSPVVIDGLAAAEHRITVLSNSGVAERTVVVSNDVVTEVVFSLPKSTAAPLAGAPIAGWVSIKSPFPVEMLEHDEVVGASGATKIMLGAGTHDVLMRNEALGFEETRKVIVTAGKVTDFEIDPPRTTVNMNALPWADVSIDGKPVGQTPLSSVAVAIGTHEVVFRHPQLGERAVQFVVTARGPNRVAVDFTK